MLAKSPSLAHVVESAQIRRQRRFVRPPYSVLFFRSFYWQYSAAPKTVMNRFFLNYVSVERYKAQLFKLSTSSNTMVFHKRIVSSSWNQNPQFSLLIQIGVIIGSLGEIQITNARNLPPPSSNTLVFVSGLLGSTLHNSILATAVLCRARLYQFVREIWTYS